MKKGVSYVSHPVINIKVVKELIIPKINTFYFPKSDTQDQSESYLILNFYTFTENNLEIY